MIQFKSEIGYFDAVTVKQLGVTGLVTGVLFEAHGIQYRVVFWTNGERRQEWMYSTEIQLT